MRFLSMSFPYLGQKVRRRIVTGEGQRHLLNRNLFHSQLLCSTKAMMTIDHVALAVVRDELDWVVDAIPAICSLNALNLFFPIVILCVGSRPNGSALPLNNAGGAGGGGFA